jgi:hypothetical protein
MFGTHSAVPAGACPPGPLGAARRGASPRARAHRRPAAPPVAASWPATLAEVTGAAARVDAHPGWVDRLSPGDSDGVRVPGPLPSLERPIHLLPVVPAVLLSAAAVVLSVQAGSLLPLMIGLMMAHGATFTAVFVMLALEPLAVRVRHGDEAAAPMERTHRVRTRRTRDGGLQASVHRVGVRRVRGRLRHTAHEVAVVRIADPWEHPAVAEDRRAELLAILAPPAGAPAG